MAQIIEYYALEEFKDGQDNKHVYPKGAPYPREGFKVSDERLQQLSTKFNNAGRAVIGRRILDDEQQEEREALEDMKVGELKELAKEKGVKGYSDLKKAELIAILNDL